MNVNKIMYVPDKMALCDFNSNSFYAIYGTNQDKFIFVEFQ